MTFLTALARHVKPNHMFDNVQDSSNSILFLSDNRQETIYHPLLLIKLGKIFFGKRLGRKGECGMLQNPVTCMIPYLHIRKQKSSDIIYPEVTLC